MKFAKGRSVHVTYRGGGGAGERGGGGERVRGGGGAPRQRRAQLERVHGAQLAQRLQAQAQLGQARVRRRAGRQQRRRVVQRQHARLRATQLVSQLGEAPEVTLQFVRLAA